ncbi:hypothetical protein [Kitasatospora cathayae]|uniref:DUF11 domain-containing protein n=1 Tax=Kitasatospora cathayae TaxID=3004092 RepID=A0ABY7Q124_9ACTN|nr:hypothetical protein [Kitasatospora sp. HUAS 3-15]WBP86321.1 hypothetical protein O1G21_11025 [Kitasatospora sp. HUAS 3-15]
MTAVVCALLTGAAVLPATAAPVAARHTGGERAAAPVSRTFNFTGAPESYMVPAGVVVTITADGAGGADLAGSCSPGGTGGRGARVVTTLPVTTASTTYTVKVGGSGGKGCTLDNVGGFNGGGPGGPGTLYAVGGGGGGGASSVGVDGTLLVVAGGGGGAGGNRFNSGVSSSGNGGNGGLPNGTDGAQGQYSAAAPGGGGQGGSTSGRFPGAGGAGGSSVGCNGGAGGSGGGFSGAAVGTGGAGGEGTDGGFCGVQGSGGGGGGGYFAGGGGGAAGGLGSSSASGGGGGGGSSFATASGTGTSFTASPVGATNSNGRVTIEYTSVAATVTAIAGTPQSTRVNTAFPTALAARVTDKAGGPVPGVRMAFTAPTAGPSGTFPGGATSVIVTANASGVATAPAFTANGTPGSYTVTAGLPDDPAVPPAPFDLTNTAPSLTISKHHAGDFTRGRQGTYTITVGNNGDAPTSGTPVTVGDTLPPGSGLTAAGISGPGWACDLSTVSCTRSDVLAAGGTYPDISLTVDVSPTAPAQVTNTATASGGGGGTATATDPTTISPAPSSLTISKTHSGKFTPGQGGVYTITVGNNGSGPTRGIPVIMKDTLPTGLTAAGISGEGWTCDLSAVTCTRSDPLAAGASYPPITLTVNVSPQAPRELVNTATVTGGGDGTATAVDRVIRGTAPPSLTISKTHTGDFTPGRSGIYTITVGNDGSGPTDGTAVIMKDALPTGLTAAGISGEGWTCVLRTLTCTRSDPLAAGASYPSITLTVKVSCRVPHEVTNTATVTGGGDTTTHTATDPTTIKHHEHDEDCEHCDNEYRSTDHKKEPAGA